MSRRIQFRLGMAAFALVAAACGDAQPIPTATAAPTSTTLATGQRAPLGVAKIPTTTSSTIPPTSTSSSTTTTTTRAVIEAGTVDNPVALGSPSVVGDWIVTVVSVDTDAEAAVVDENPFNDPAAEGEKFVLVGIEATYIGGDTAWPWIDIDHWMLGEDNLLYKGIDSECGVIAGDLAFIGEVFPGGTVAGKVCHRVAADDAARAVLVVEEGFTIGESDAAVFSLRAGVGSVPLAVPPNIPAIVAGGPLGSIGNPIERASPGMVGDWRVSVNSLDLDATAAILAENQFNDPPASGFTYVLVGLEATNEGSESADPWRDIRSKVLGESRVAYEGFETYCGVIPDDVTAVGDVEPGTTVSFNMCWAVGRDDIESLLLILEDYQDFESRRLFYALG